MSSTSPTSVSPDHTAPTPAGSWPAVLALAGATFSVVTTEMLPVGLLPALGDGLRVSDGTAGLALTLPGLVAAVAAPLLPVAVRRADRRHVLCALLLLLAVADLLSALAPEITVLLAARALVGVCIGGVWALAAGLAVRLVPAASVGRATSVVFSGVAVASVLGVPAGTFLGAVAGWRWAFVASAAPAAAGTVALALALPPLPAERPLRLRELRHLAAHSRIRRGLLAVGLLVTGHFAAYTYVRPVLDRVPGLGAGRVSTLLLGYGLAGVAGTFTAGTLAARDPRRTLYAIAAVLGTTVALLVPAAASLPASTALLLLWGFAYGGVSVSAQTWLSANLPEEAREGASALAAGLFNTAIAGGAFIGGRTADTLGAAGALSLGAGLILAALPPAALPTRASGRSVEVSRPGPTGARPRPGRPRRPDTAGDSGASAGGWDT
ncbi:MFS transporter [Streptomyces sp. NPDC049687]|uniref:MFS transporter n=1 Tax=Streptomyces sp. NPDC049687 TaxID=3365596 RepID=UPI0037ACD3BE